MTIENNQLVHKMIDACMEIMRDCTLFSDISEAGWEKANKIQEMINAIKHEVLELEKMI